MININLILKFFLLHIIEIKFIYNLFNTIYFTLLIYECKIDELKSFLIN